MNADDWNSFFAVIVPAPKYFLRSGAEAGAGLILSEKPHGPEVMTVEVVVFRAGLPFRPLATFWLN